MTALCHHGTTIRFICDHLAKAVDNYVALDGGKDRAERIRNAVMPIIPGTSIIMACSYAERIAIEACGPGTALNLSAEDCAPKVNNIKSFATKLGLDQAWQGWGEFENFLRLRHCFAHECGMATKRQKKGIEDFLELLLNGNVLWDKDAVAPYYEVDKGRLVMRNGWNHRLRLVLVHYARLFEDNHRFSLAQ